MLFYESPNISTNVCGRIYLANQSQLVAQNYSFQTPVFEPNTPIAFSIYSNRLSGQYIDASRITLNGTSVGDIWTPDPFVPDPGTGVQGHYWYQNGEVEGLNGDVANTTVHMNDGVAVVNQYLNLNQQNQLLRIERIVANPVSGFNPHPAFTLAYTPTCTPPTATMLRSLTFCRTETSGEARQLQTIAGYDHYQWTPGHLLSDSMIANPVCLADSSGWFRVRMWNDDESGVCSQTIPVFVTVGQVPRPSRLFTRSSPCPNPTGRIAFEGMAGTPPFQFTVGGLTQSDTLFTGLAAGTYPVSVVDALGCTWDSVAVIPLNPLQEAAFTANPSEGFTPLRVAFTNESSTISTGYQWLIDGEPLTTATNLSYTFADSGTYQVALVAYYVNETCTDTAFVTIRVDQGLELIIPNIISPNGDGRNDALVAQIAGVAELRWQIFNRWGQEVHAATQSGLDGEESILLWSPTELSAGVYSLIIQAIGTSASPGDPSGGQRSQLVSQVMVVR